MRYRIVFITGLGVGFVLGARAGRERYEQLQTLARRVRDNPAVQQAAGALQAQVSSYAKSAAGKLTGGAVAAKAKAGEVLHERVPGRRTRDANGRANGDGTGHYVPAADTPTAQPGG